MARLQQHYREKVAPELKAKFGYTSSMQARGGPLESINLRFPGLRRPPTW
jgi:ribosomal protein L5